MVIGDRNRHPPGWQTIAKTYEVEKFIRKAIACNMIRPSDAPGHLAILSMEETEETEVISCFTFYCWSVSFE